MLVYDHVVAEGRLASLVDHLGLAFRLVALDQWLRRLGEHRVGEDRLRVRLLLLLRLHELGVGAQDVDLLSFLAGGDLLRALLEEVDRLAALLCNEKINMVLQTNE